MTYFSIPIDDFRSQPQIIFRGVGQQFTLPLMKYFGILIHHYTWSNKELKNFPVSFKLSKTSYFIRLFGILTSDARNFSSGNIMLLI